MLMYFIPFLHDRDLYVNHDRGHGFHVHHDLLYVNRDLCKNVHYRGHGYHFHLDLLYVNHHVHHDRDLYVNHDLCKIFHYRGHGCHGCHGYHVHYFSGYLLLHRCY